MSHICTGCLSVTFLGTWDTSSYKTRLFGASSLVGTTEDQCQHEKLGNVWHLKSVKCFRRQNKKQNPVGSWWGLGQGWPRAVFHKSVTDATGLGSDSILQDSERRCLSQSEIAHRLPGSLTGVTMFRRWCILNKRHHFNVMVIGSTKWIWSGITPDHKARVSHGGNVSEIGLPREKWGHGDPRHPNWDEAESQMTKQTHKWPACAQSMASSRNYNAQNLQHTFWGAVVNIW